MKVVVIGAGVAGLVAALTAAECKDEVILLCKDPYFEGSASSWAQGGVVYRGKQDSPKKLYQDIVGASGGMANKPIVDVFVREAPGVLERLLIKKIKVPFKKIGEEYQLAGEASHSSRRILFSGDRTGMVIVENLLKRVEAHPRIKIKWSHMAVDLINIPHHSKNPLAVYEQSCCVGVYAHNIITKKVVKFFSDKIILAAGGIGRIYEHTTNPPGATGDGVAIAYRAGARVINMEFTQFHPTTLAVKGANNFLISEAMRGEGAEIVNNKGRAFMKKYDPRGSLSPRDIVARAIVKEQLRTHSEHMYLTLKNCDFDFKTRFPSIYQKCIEFDLDVHSSTFKGIPITPAFHYSCGGVFTNQNGETSIKNLYAVGEVACTGLHGANRLASTSLLEGMYFGYQAARVRNTNSIAFNKSDVSDWSSNGKHLDPVDLITVKKDFTQIKNIMWNYVGIVRYRKQLEMAVEELKNLKDKIDSRYRKSLLGRDILELRNAIQVALLVANSAIKNRKSMGCHYLVT